MRCQRERRITLLSQRTLHRRPPVPPYAQPRSSCHAVVRITSPSPFFCATDPLKRPPERSGVARGSGSGSAALACPCAQAAAIGLSALAADHGGRVAVTNQLRSYEPEKPPLAARSHTTLSGHGCQPHAGMWPRSTQGVEHRRDGDEVHSLLHLPLLCDLLEILPRQHVVVPLREPLAREQDA